MKVMSKDATPIRYDQTAITEIAAQLSFASAALSLILLAVLHVIEPEFDPSWRMVSEYALGPYGWVLTLSFLAMALSCAALFVTVQSEIRTISGKIGLALLLVVAAALTTAAFFTGDPITSTSDQLTTHGNIHAFAAMVGVPGLPIAAILITRSLVRNPAWSSARRSLLWAANLTWISLVLMFLVIALLLPQQGGFGPGVVVG
jgi:hypothetical protein